MKVNLYTMAGCHLCEEALDLLQVLQEQLEVQGRWLQISEIDIADSKTLMAVYDVRIPVITSDLSPGDIGWPFSLNDLSLFLKLS